MRTAKQIKISFVGETGTGKTQLIRRLTSKPFCDEHQSVTGFKFHKVKEKFLLKDITVGEPFHTEGKPFHTEGEPLHTYCHGSDVFVLCVDISSRDCTEKSIKYFEKNKDNIVPPKDKGPPSKKPTGVVVAFTKSDLVKNNETMPINNALGEYAQKVINVIAPNLSKDKCQYIVTSAKKDDDTNIQQMLTLLDNVSSPVPDDGVNDLLKHFLENTQKCGVRFLWGGNLVSFNGTTYVVQNGVKEALIYARCMTRGSSLICLPDYPTYTIDSLKEQLTDFIKNYAERDNSEGLFKRRTQETQTMYSCFRCGMAERYFTSIEKNDQPLETEPVTFLSAPH